MFGSEAQVGSQCTSRQILVLIAGSAGGQVKETQAGSDVLPSKCGIPSYIEATHLALHPNDVTKDSILASIGETLRCFSKRRSVRNYHSLLS